MIPSTFCTFATNVCADDLTILLKSLSKYHTNSVVFIFVDTPTHEHILTLDLNLQLNITVNLDMFTSNTRHEMVMNGSWTDFQLIKSNVIDHALSQYSDVLYLDADIMITNPIVLDISGDDELVLSPHYIKESDVRLYGYFNGGFIWTSSKQFALKWREFTKTSRYYDQASLEECARYFKTKFLTQNYNIAEWSLWQSEESPGKMIQYLSIDANNIYFKNNPIIFFHHHFKRDTNHRFNHIVYELLSRCDSKRELLSFIS